MGGLARINGRAVMVIGHQKAATPRKRSSATSACPPEGYRKALRLMKMAERFGLPVLTLIDTAGAWPGIDAESRGQSEAIARNLIEMAELKVPIICTVIGEGGSGGALALGGRPHRHAGICGVFDHHPGRLRLDPVEGRRQGQGGGRAAGLTAPRLKSLGLVDKVVREPTGGAHRNPTQMAKRLKAVLLNELDALDTLSTEQLLEQRYTRLRSYGTYEAACSAGRWPATRGD